MNSNNSGGPNPAHTAQISGRTHDDRGWCDNTVCHCVGPLTPVAFTPPSVEEWEQSMATLVTTF